MVVDVREASLQNGCRAGIGFTKERGAVTGAVQAAFETSNPSEKAGDLVLGGGRRLAMFRSQFADFNGSPRAPAWPRNYFVEVSRITPSSEFSRNSYARTPNPLRRADTKLSGSVAWKAPPILRFAMAGSVTMRCLRL